MEARIRLILGALSCRDRRAISFLRKTLLPGTSHGPTTMPKTLHHDSDIHEETPC